jgi:5,10-methylenetetrahydromethanopterin reductase
MTKATEFGLLFESARAGESVAHAKLAEELGFASYWVPEDYAFPGAFSICSAIAGQTRQIKIGIGVLNPYTRHPVLTAMEFAALDQLSDGRGILGIGAGVRLWIEDQLGIPYSRPVTTMREMVAIVRALFRGEELAYSGRAFKVAGLRFSAEPVRSEIPIHLGATGPRSLRLAGEAADGVLLNCMLSGEFVRAAVGHVRDGAATAGRDLQNFAMGALLFVAMSDDEAKAREMARPFVSWVVWLFARQPQLPIFAEAGLTEAEIKRLADSPNPLPEIIRDAVLDRFALVGCPARCREGLARVIDAGITHPVLAVGFGSGEDSAPAARNVAEQLVSHFL